jgi:EpsI family protein
MSMTDVSTRPEVAAATTTGPRSGRPAVRWGPVLLVCVLLVGSGVARWWQSGRIGAMLEQGKRSPFPLETVPMTLGEWKGKATEFDPEIARKTGAIDSIFRHYVNQQTGVGVDVIVLYGPSTEMYIHMPENCYPRAGYAEVAAPAEHAIKAGGIEAPFRSLLYAKGEGGQAELQEVYYSWRYNGHWTPQVGTQKQFERIPGMYKIHLARLVKEGERREVGNPCEALLHELLPEIERRFSAAVPPRPRG